MISARADQNHAIVWDPAWTADMITPEGRQILGLE
jgi:metal-sulfur cluster biosynthetic enzyme